MNNRTVIILAGEGDSTNVVYHFLRQEFDINNVIIEQPVPQSVFLKRRLKKLGFKVVAGQVLFKLLIARSLAEKSKERIKQILDESTLSATAIPNEKVIRVESINSDACIQKIKELNPAVVVVNGTRIISKKVLGATSAIFINMHAGITPLYRGVHGGYWALVNNDIDNCGVTVHLVDQGIDTGNILYQERIKPVKGKDNFVTYPFLQLKTGLPLLKKAVKDALEDNVKIKPSPEGVSRLWSHPTLFEYIKNKKAGID